MAKVLGQTVAAPRDYSPDILEAIPREVARSRFAAGDPLPAYGVDVWHLYELSWLDAEARPQQYVGVLTLAADSVATVESKSLKLYLNSLNFHRFDQAESARACIENDVARITGGEVSLTLMEPSDIGTITREPEGELIDHLAIPAAQAGLSPRDLLTPQEGGVGEHRWISHKLRSLCPVTGQPDWATLVVHTRGSTVSPTSLSRYIDSFREHQDFHEHCVEQIFIDVQVVAQPEALTVVAFYQRRGGIDITPWRSAVPFVVPTDRMGRQ